MVVVGHLTLVCFVAFVCAGGEETKSTAAAGVVEVAGVRLAGGCQTAICEDAL